MARLTRAQRYQNDVKLVGKLEQFWKPRQELMSEKARFLIDGQHYEDEETLERDSRYVRWVGQETFNAWRHETGAMTAVPPAINARPVAYSDATAEEAEWAVRQLQAEYEDPYNEYDDVLEDWVGSASALGVGYFTFDWLPREGRWGKIVPSYIDPRDVMPDPRVKSIHSRKCRFVVIRFRESIAWAKQQIDDAGWDSSAVKKLRPDEGYNPRFFETYLKTMPGGVVKLGSSDKSEAEWRDDDEFTGYAIWRRSSGEQGKVPIEDTYEPFQDPGERYMKCLNPDCDGYRTKTQREEKQEFPESGGECPECGSTLERIDGRESAELRDLFPDGRLTIIAPYSGLSKPLYDDGWPCPLPSYPFGELKRFRHPLRPDSPGLADINWWNQLATDMIMRLAVERLIHSAPFLMAPKEGLVDGDGNQFQFTDENGWIMYYLGEARPDVEVVEGSGIPAAWSPVYQAAQAALTSKMGIADFGLSPEQSRDIPASSVAQQIQQQEIPLAHFQRRYQRELGRSFGNLWAMMRHYYTDERVRAQFDDEGPTVNARRPGDLPFFNFFIEDAPAFSALDDGKIKGFQALMQTAQQFPFALDFFAQTMNIPPSVTRTIKNGLAAMPKPPQPGMPPGQLGQPPAPLAGLNVGGGPRYAPATQGGIANGG